MLWVVLWTTTACAPVDATDRGPAETSAAEPEVLRELRDLLAETRSSDAPGRCVTQYASLQDDILAGLTARVSGPGKPLRQGQPERLRDCVPFGPVHLCVPEQASVADPHLPRAAEPVIGWRDIEGAVANAGDDLEAWAAIASATLFLVKEELQHRDGAAPHISHPRRNLLGRLSAAAHRCHLAVDCLEPEILAFDAEQLAAADPFLAGTLRNITEASLPRVKRWYIHELEWWLYARRFSVERRPYPKARTGAGFVEIPIHPGDFRGVRVQIAQVVEDAWSQPGLAVRLVWVEADDIYRLHFDLAAIQSSVNRSDRRVILGAFVTPKVIAHEFGHVLGLEDTYTYSWNDETCAVDSFAEPSDLMAEHESGAPTRDHLDWLLDTYGR